jgi:serine/threonine protein kinase
VGTPTYMSPEQITGNQGLDQRSDVYSFGVMAYTLFTGRPPFRSENQAELMYKVVHETPPSPDTLNPELPPHIVQAVNRVLVKDPAKRFNSVFEFVTALVKPPTVLNFGSSTLLDEAAASTKRHWRLKRLARNGLAMAAVLLLLFLAWPYRSQMQSQATRLYQIGVEPRAAQVSGLVTHYTDPKQNPTFWEVQPIDWYRLNNFGQEYGIRISTTPLKKLWTALGHFRFSGEWVSQTWQSLHSADTGKAKQPIGQPQLSHADSSAGTPATIPNVAADEN